eukprot:673672-Pleurochrysis_carterae.AAC.1
MPWILVHSWSSVCFRPHGCPCARNKHSARVPAPPTASRQTRRRTPKYGYLVIYRDEAKGGYVESGLLECMNSEIVDAR